MLQVAMLIFQLLPALIAGIKAVEPLFASGQGAHKLDTVLNAVQGVALDAPMVIGAGADAVTAAKVGDVPGMSTALTTTINALVKGFNAAGIFQKSGAVQAITAAQDKPATQA